YTSDYELDRGYVDSLTGVKVCAFHSWFYLSELTLTPGILKGARNGLKEFDIVHLHAFRSFQNLVICYYARKYGIPYIIDAHGSTRQQFPNDQKGKWVIRWLFDILFGYRMLRNAARAVGETKIGVAEYEQLGVTADKIALVLPPFDTEAFSHLPPHGIFRGKYNLDGKKIVLFLGRIHSVKGLDFLVEGFHELTKTRTDVLLVIVGQDDGYKATLDKLISSLKLGDKVLYTGFLGGQDKLSALVDADVVAQTSVYEQGAWAPIEGALCGTPIVVTGHTGAGEDVKRMDAGYLVEYGNKKQLADILANILRSPDEGRNKAKRAADYVRANLSMNKNIENYEQLYMECLRLKESKRGTK
ncbi:MAG: glycosyltransferase, partial [Candidatus Tectomicrobia bacterium]|nr:glycosyltransferase [Candidatus Tectomicrobia bacterium]